MNPNVCECVASPHARWMLCKRSQSPKHDSQLIFRVKQKNWSFQQFLPKKTGVRGCGRCRHIPTGHVLPRNCAIVVWKWPGQCSFVGDDRTHTEFHNAAWAADVLKRREKLYKVRWQTHPREVHNAAFCVFAGARFRPAAWGLPAPSTGGLTDTNVFWIMFCKRDERKARLSGNC